MSSPPLIGIWITKPRISLRPPVAGRSPCGQPRPVRPAGVHRQAGHDYCGEKPTTGRKSPHAFRLETAAPVVRARLSFSRVTVVPPQFDGVRGSVEAVIGVEDVGVAVVVDVTHLDVVAAGRRQDLPAPRRPVAL